MASPPESDSRPAPQEMEKELNHLRRRIPELERQAGELGQAKLLLNALFDISEVAHSSADFRTFYATLHQIIGTLMYAENMLIAVRSPETGGIRFEFVRDSVDTDLTPEAINQLPQEQLANSLTAHVINSGELVHVDAAGTVDLCRRAGIDMIGSPSVDWLAVPLKLRGETLGALVVQSYDPEVVFREREEQLLEFVSQHIAALLDRKWSHAELKLAKEDLEKRIILRTGELERINAELEREIRQRRHGEKLQKALFRITKLAGESLDMHSFYQAIHAVISGLVYARNIFVAIADEEAGELCFVYHEDEVEENFDPIPIPENPLEAGPSMRIYATGEPLLYRHDHDAQPPEGYRGALSYAWLGVPLKSDEQVIGVLAIQSYDKQYSYEESDMKLLTFVGRHIAATIERRQDKLALERAHEELEVRVLERTRELQAANAELRTTLEQLSETQAQLVESEKMASLGSLVAGVAHEINTPLGVAVTAASHLQKQARKLIRTMREDREYAPDAATIERLCEEPIGLLLGNLTKASHLVASFKQVAADQSTEDRRVFNLARSLDEIVTSLRPKVRKAGHTLELDAPADVEINGYPFALYQIVSNLVMNSHIHAFEPGTRGTMTIRVEDQPDHVRLIYSDDGRGMDPATRQRIFEPFFTTRRGRGGTGLGMHIAYNHVVKLGGTIRCDSESGRGTRFEIRLPHHQQASGRG